MDRVVVERLVAGRPCPGARAAERRAAVDVLLRRRPEMSQVEIAEIVDVSRRTVERRARAVGLASRATQKRPTGETRAIIRDLILESPRLSTKRAGVLAGVSVQTAQVHYANLVADGELPARTLAEIDNPRYKGYR